MFQLSSFEKFYIASTLLCVFWTAYAAWVTRTQMSKWRMGCLASFHPICFTVEFRPDPASNRKLGIFLLISLLPVLNVILLSLYAIPWIIVAVVVLAYQIFPIQSRRRKQEEAAELAAAIAKYVETHARPLDKGQTDAQK